MKSRRINIIKLGVAPEGFVLSILLLLLSIPVFSQERIWEGTKCKNRSVTLTEYLPEGEPRAAIVVCPGGSYHWHDMETEGTSVAKWLASEGYAAYVLKYRVAGKFEFASKYRTIIRGHRHPDMICDIQRAIQLVRERYNGPVGAIGFSAGGHLVMSAGEYFNTNFLAKYGIEPEVSLRPDFVAPIYPVVTLSAPPVHKRSRLGLLGEWTVLKQEMRDSMSLEKHVKADTPPVFLLNCVDDPIVDYRNSELLDSALTVRQIPHLYIQYATGGHGFGANPEKQNEETKQWQALFIEWLHEYGH
jgi:acetyl esterase/lipase